LVYQAAGHKRIRHLMGKSGQPGPDSEASNMDASGL